jgi:hypothetical protein
MAARVTCDIGAGNAHGVRAPVLPGEVASCGSAWRGYADELRQPRAGARRALPRRQLAGRPRSRRRRTEGGSTEDGYERDRARLRRGCARRSARTSRDCDRGVELGAEWARDLATARELEDIARMRTTNWLYWRPSEEDDASLDGLLTEGERGRASSLIHFARGVVDGAAMVLGRSRTAPVNRRGLSQSPVSGRRRPEIPPPR